jgi:hypothetical protein
MMHEMRGWTGAIAAALVVAAAGGCATGRVAPAAGGAPASSSELAALHAAVRADGIEKRTFTHADFWGVAGPVIDAAPALAREEIGRSAEGRPLYLVRVGTGPTRVLLWSQMHGDESTATMALADLFRYLGAESADARTQRLAERLTVWVIPMLNPDGAERFQRRNALGIDVNRDARELATPEARALKQVRDRFQPDFGFNLHDQNVRTRVGDQDRTAAIALLAPAVDEARSDPAVRVRAKRLAAVIRDAVEPLVPGHVARYDDTFNPRAFGDLMGAWGTSTVLIESGGWRDDPQKQHLRKANFVALVAALESIATESYADADLARYESLLENGRPANDLLIRRATIVLPGAAPFRADLAIDYAVPLERRGGRIADVGDLAGYSARDTVDATGLFLHPTADALSPGQGGVAVLRTGAPAALVARRSERADAGEPVWVIEGGAVQRPAN